jgi:hypothetical protein
MAVGLVHQDRDAFWLPHGIGITRLHLEHVAGVDDFEVAEGDLPSSDARLAPRPGSRYGNRGPEPPRTCVLINRDCSAITGCRKRRVRCAGSSGDLLPPSPPAEKANARQDQAGQSGTGDKLRARAGQPA